MLIPQISRVRIICGVDINMFKLSFLCKTNFSHCLQYVTKLYKSRVLSHSKVLSTLNKIRINKYRQRTKLSALGTERYRSSCKLCVFVCVCVCVWVGGWASLGAILTTTFSASRGFPRSAFAHGKEPASLEILFTLKCVATWKPSTWKSSLVLC
jgi:hypothetical protein